jgi:hypothetical protein
MANLKKPADRKDYRRFAADVIKNGKPNFGYV